jgi:hypothetical protein
MFLDRIGKPSIYLPVCIATRGPILALTSVAHDFIGALLTRFFSVICECTFFPVSDHWRLFRARSHEVAGSLVPSLEMVEAQ